MKSNVSLCRWLHPAFLFAATTELSLEGILLAQGRQSRVGSLLHADVCESACSNPVVCTIRVILFHMWLGLSLARVFHLKTVCPKLEYSGTCALQASSCFYMHMFYGGAGPRQAQMDCRLMESTFQTNPV